MPRGMFWTRFTRAHCTELSVRSRVCVRLCGVLVSDCVSVGASLCVGALACGARRVTGIRHTPRCAHTRAHAPCTHAHDHTHVHVTHVQASSYVHRATTRANSCARVARVQPHATMAFIRKVIVGGAIIGALTLGARPAVRRLAFSIPVRAAAPKVYAALCEPGNLATGTGVNVRGVGRGRDGRPCAASGLWLCWCRWTLLFVCVSMGGVCIDARAAAVAGAAYQCVVPFRLLVSSWRRVRVRLTAGCVRACAWPACGCACLRRLLSHRAP